MEEKKKVLIVIYSNSQFNEMIRVAELLTSSKQYIPIIYFQINYISSQHSTFKDVLEKKKIAFYFLGDFIKNNFTNEKNTNPAVFIKKIWRRLSPHVGNLIFRLFNVLLFILPNRLNVKLVSGLINSYNFLVKYHFSRKAFPLSRFIYDTTTSINNMLNQIQYNLVILPEENVSCLSQYLVKKANDKGVATIILPYSISNPRESYESFYDSYNKKNVDTLNNFLVKQYPQWGKLYKDKTLSFSNDYILFFEKNKLTPHNPWLIDSGFAKAIAVDSLAIKKSYQKFGIHSSKLILTGSLYHDDIYKINNDKQQHKNELYSSLGLPLNKPMILCALPPDILSYGRNPTGFQNYTDLLQYWIQELSHFTNRFNVIINLHPFTTQNQIKDIAFFDTKISNKKVAHLIPLSDLYIASISSTIRFAIGCGIPVINWDVYKYGYEDYDDAKSVLKVETQEAFSSTLTKVMTENGFYQSLKKTQKADKHNWSFNDNKSSDRFLELFEKLSV